MIFIHKVFLIKILIKWRKVKILKIKRRKIKIIKKINSKNEEKNSILIKLKTNTNNFNKKNCFPKLNFNKDNTDEFEVNQYNIKSVAYLSNS